MRYFIYKDSQIMGPYSPEDLGQSGPLHPDTLVCEEGVSGRRDSDWKSLGEVAELSGVRVSSAAALTLAEEPLPGEPGILERLELESLGIPLEDEDSGDWLAGLFEDAEFKKRWGTTVSEAKEAGKDQSAQLSAAESKIHDLTSQLEQLQERLRELESGKGAPEAQQLVPKPAPAKKAIKFGATKSFRVIRKEGGPAEPEVLPGMPAFESGPEAPLTPPPLSSWSISSEEESSAPAALPAAKAVPPLAPEPLPEPPKAAEPGLSLPAAPSLPPVLEPPPRTPAPTLAPPPVLGPVTPPPAATPAEPAPPAPTPPPKTLEAPPIPADLASSRKPTPAPLTAVFSAAAPPFPSPKTPIAATPGPATQDVVARLAKPAAAPASPPPPPKSRAGFSRKFIVGSGALLLLLIVTGALFFRNSRELKLMLNMGGEHKPLGSEPEEEARTPFKRQPPEKPEAKPKAEAPQPAPAAEEATPAAKPDNSEAAISLVKSYPLDGDRGTVGQWLQYSFTANPEDGNKEEWTAKVGEAAPEAYLVEYRVTPGAKSSLKEPFTYLFEADLARKTVRGSNPAARQLMGGAPRPKAKRKPAPARRKPRPAAASPKRREVPLLPLPSDAELLPPAEDDASFKNDTVNRGL